MKAVICPVCNGCGLYPAIACATKEDTGTDASEKPVESKPCHGCEGKGWVSVPED